MLKHAALIAVLVCAAAASAQVVIDMPPPPADYATDYEEENDVGAVALDRYAGARTFPTDTYASPAWGGWWGWPYRAFGYGYGYGYGWSPFWWGHRWGYPWWRWGHGRGIWRVRFRYVSGFAD